MKPDHFNTAAGVMSGVTVVAPARKEGARVGAFLRGLIPYLDLIRHVVIVLDGPDVDAIDSIRPLLEHYGSRLTVRTQEAPVGKTRAIRHGLIHVTSRYALLWDADLEYGLCALPALVRSAAGDTLVSGRRQSGRGWKSILANALVRVCLRVHGVPPSDVLTGVHLAETRWLLSALDAGHEGRYTLETVLVRAALADGLYLYDVPVAYRPRSIAQGRGVRWYHLPALLRAAA